MSIQSASVSVISPLERLKKETERIRTVFAPLFTEYLNINLSEYWDEILGLDIDRLVESLVGAIPEDGFGHDVVVAKYGQIAADMILTCLDAQVGMSVMVSGVDYATLPEVTEEAVESLGLDVEQYPEGEGQCKSSDVN